MTDTKGTKNKEPESSTNKASLDVSTMDKISGGGGTVACTGMSTCPPVPPILK